MRECPSCGINMSDYHFNAKFCSVKCRHIKDQKERVKKSIEKYKDKPEVPECLICGYRGNNLTPHIAKAHKITTKEYKEKFNVDASKIYSTKYLKVLSDNISGERNPGYKHDGKLSPFSKNFVGYKDLSENDKENTISSMAKDAQKRCRENGNAPTTLEYYIKRGMNKSEARKALCDRQNTFTKEKCIEKYGKEEGLKVWKDRQERWQKTLNSKPIEEQERICRAKMCNGRGYSKISQEVFWQIYKEIEDDYKDIFFAELNMNAGIHQEYMHTCNNKKRYFFDFYIKDNNKIIEFDGSYWHGPKRGNQERDRLRNEQLIEEGFDIYHIKENDYRAEPEKIIKQCLNFLNK